MSEEPALPEVLSTTEVFQGRVFRLTRDTVRMPDGVETVRDTIHHPGAVGMVPMDAEGNVYLVTQYRHAAGKRLLEIPAGTLEPGEASDTTAIRELQEEIGMKPGHIEPLGGFFVAPGYASEYIWLFLCTELTESVLEGDEDEDIEVQKMSLSEAVEAVHSGLIEDAKTMVALLRLSQRYGQ